MARCSRRPTPSGPRALVLYEAQPRMSWAPDYDWALRARGARGVASGGAISWGDGSRVAALVAELPPNTTRAAGVVREARAPGGEPGDGGEADADERRRSTSAPCCPRSRRQRWCCTAPADKFIDIRHSRYLAEHIPGARLRRAAGRRRRSRSAPTPDGRARRDRGVPDRRAPRARPGADPGDGDVLGHRRLDQPRGRARRSPLARPARVDGGRGRPASCCRFRGRAVKTMGDGFLATFDGPARAIRCATAIAR